MSSQSSFRLSSLAFGLLWVIPLCCEAQDAPKEISVTADAVYAAPPDFVQIIVGLESTAPSAKEAETAIENKVSQLRNALKQGNFEASIRDRNRTLQASTGPGTPWRAGTLVLAKRLLAVESANIASSAPIIDTLLQKGADRIESIRFSVRNALPLSTAALKLASARAKEKAEVVAQSLGLNVGTLLSLNETVEPGAEIVRQRMELGEGPGQFSDEELHVIVTARFEVKPK